MCVVYRIDSLFIGNAVVALMSRARATSGFCHVKMVLSPPQTSLQVREERMLHRNQE
jgi:hypothetical protein